VLDCDGELALGLSDTQTYDLVSVEFLGDILDKIQNHKTIVVDANLPQESLVWLAQNKGSDRLFAAPVSPSKAMRFQRALDRIDIFIGNEREVAQLTDLPCQSVLEAVQAARVLRQLGVTIVVVTLGPQGAVISSPELEAHFAIVQSGIVDVNGAGDSFFAGFTHALHTGLSLEDAMRTGIASASIMVETPGPVWDDLSSEQLNARLKAVPPHRILP
jgi:pseudouridine kinase